MGGWIFGNENQKQWTQSFSRSEKYYFYNNFSYNFQPNLVYEAIAKGLDIRTEREELSKQVKERAKEEETRRKEQMAIDNQRRKDLEEVRRKKEENRRSLITIVLSAFAVISILCDLNSLIKDAYTGEADPTPAKILLWISPLAIFIIVTLHFILNKQSENEENQDN